MVVSKEVRSEVAVSPSQDGSPHEVSNKTSVERTTRLTWLERAEQFGYLAMGTVTTLILFRFFLVMLDVNRASGFAQWILGVTHPLVSPFLNLFGSQLTAGRAVFEFPDLVAILVYSLAGIFLLRLGRLIFEPTRHEAV